jgi:membrane protein YqaA with SNARE-associated domain|tara:strand:+ start:488 stop:1081 length:594 start_codon:yes stop_codon:yes gene_type:complete
LLKRKIHILESYANEKLIAVYISIFAITESIFNPFPVEILLIPAVLKYRKKYIKIAILAALMSTFGALIGYMIGFYLDELMLSKFIDLSIYQSMYQRYGSLIILIGAITPFPFKIVTIASGIFKMNLFYLVIYSLIGRYLRYQIITLLTYHLGPKMIDLYKKIDQNTKLFTKIFIVISIIFIALIIYYTYWTQKNAF